jgi:hypothetical protein
MSANPSDNTWTDSLDIAQIHGDLVSTRPVLSSLTSFSEAGPAWARVVDADHVVVLVGSAFSTYWELLTLSTEAVRRLGDAASVPGVIHAPV